MFPSETQPMSNLATRQAESDYYDNFCSNKIPPRPVLELKSVLACAVRAAIFAGAIMMVPWYCLV